MNALSAPRSVEELEEQLSRPPADVVEQLARLDGEILFLGVGGKMGPTMARMEKRALDVAGNPQRVIGVSRFSDPQVRESLAAAGIETIGCDLLDEHAVAALPEASHVISMSGFKFGASGNPALTWATNCVLPAQVCRRFADSSIVTFSTGNVYGNCPVNRGGSLETDEPNPIGEYAMAALGRERVYQYFCERLNTPTCILRLNYATELRYGVLVDLGAKVMAEQAIDLTTAFVNVIWLADANAMTLRAFNHGHCPARVLNVAGSELLRVRDICEALGRHLGKTPRFVGSESEEALLSDASAAATLLGSETLSATTMIEWTADWLSRGGPLLNKPTHFQERSGRF